MYSLYTYKYTLHIHVCILSIHIHTCIFCIHVYTCMYTKYTYMYTKYTCMYTSIHICIQNIHICMLQNSVNPHHNNHPFEGLVFKQLRPQFYEGLRYLYTTMHLSFFFQVSSQLLRKTCIVFAIFLKNSNFWPLILLFGQF